MMKSKLETKNKNTDIASRWTIAKQSILYTAKQVKHTLLNSSNSSNSTSSNNSNSSSSNSSNSNNSNNRNSNSNNNSNNNTNNNSINNATKTFGWFPATAGLTAAPATSTKLKMLQRHGTNLVAREAQWRAKRRAWKRVLWLAWEVATV